MPIGVVINPEIEMVEVICSRSGLKFEAENRRKKVHPEISFYTTHKDWDFRYAAVAVIERGKAEGWDSIEKFKEEIKKALNPEPQPRPDYDFEGNWAAKITGSDIKYRFSRNFLTPVDKEGRFKRYNLAAAGDGIYETCYESAKGNKTRRYWRIENGELIDLQLEDVEKLFPEIVLSSIEGCIKVDKYFPEGSTVEHEGELYTVVRLDSVEQWEDEDGIAGTGRNYGGTHIVWEETQYTAYLRPATEEEIAEYNARKQAKAEKATAIARLIEIAKTITTENKAPRVSDYPKGKEFVIRQGHFQANEVLLLEDDGDRLWYLIFNGRDGDDWRPNNVASAYIGRYLEISPDLRIEIEELLKKC